MHINPYLLQFTGFSASYPRAIVRRAFVFLSLIWVLMLQETHAGLGQWTQTSGPEGGNVRVVVVAPSQPSTLYAGTWGGVFYSLDSGANWHATDTSVTGTFIDTLAVDPRDSSTVYIYSWRGYFKTTDGGVSWQPWATGIQTNVPHQMAVDPTDSSIVYGRTYSDDIVFEITNDGENVEIIDINDGPTWPKKLGLDPVPTLGIVSAVAYDPVTPSTMYASSFTNGIFKSTDWGANYEPINKGLIATTVWSLVEVPSTPSTLFASCNSGIYKSSDHGASWTKVTEGLPDFGFSSLVVDPSATNVLYAASMMGVFKSDDGGDTWQSKSTGLPDSDFVRLTIDPNRPATLYAGTSAGVYKTVDGGESWYAINSGLPESYIAAPAIDPTNSSNLYASVFDGGVDEAIYKSTDGGETWSIVKDNVALVSTILVDSSAPETVFAANWSFGVWEDSIIKSSDGGQSWTSTGLTNKAVMHLIQDPNTPTTLYAGTWWGSGVLKSTDAGATWSDVGLLQQDVTWLTLSDANPPTLYAGTYGGGVYTYTLSTSPNEFSFEKQTGVETGIEVISNTIVVTGIETATPISITNGEYSTNGQPYTSEPGSVRDGDNVAVRVISANTLSTSVSAHLDIGDVGAEFTVTTLDDLTPEEFAFVEQVGLARSEQVTSNTISVNGISVPVSVTITGGEYSVNGGDYVNSPGSVENGDEIIVRVMSSNNFNASVVATLTVGDVSRTFKVTTEDNAAPVLQAPITDKLVVAVGQQSTIEISATDANHDDTHSLAAVFASTGTEASSLGTLSWSDHVLTLSATAAGTDTIIVTVTDVQGKSDQLSLPLTVEVPPAEVTNSQETVSSEDSESVAPEVEKDEGEKNTAEAPASTESEPVADVTGESSAVGATNVTNTEPSPQTRSRFGCTLGAPAAGRGIDPALPLLIILSGLFIGRGRLRGIKNTQPAGRVNAS